MKNWAISTARSAYYATTEPVRLRHARWEHGDGIDGVWNRGDPLVSVIIPTHNRAKILRDRALASIKKQTYRNLEIIIAAHGCTDDTVRELLDYEISVTLRGKCLIVPRKPKYPPTAENHWFAGPVDPINAGLKWASGKWIARIDDDDTWTPDHIEKLLRFAQGGNYEFVSSAYVANGKPVEHDGYEPPIGGVQTWLARSYLKLFRANPDCWRRRIHRVNDTELAHRYRMAGVRTGWTPAVTAKIEPRPGETVIGLKAYQQNRAETERKYAF